MAERVIEQSASEPRLHRVLYFLKFLRAMILHNILNAVALTLFFTLGLRGIYWPADSLINNMAGLLKYSRDQDIKPYFLVLFALIIVLVLAAFLYWIYISITKVWRISLRFQIAILAIVLLSFLFDVWPRLQFSFTSLTPLFSGLAVLFYGLCVVAIIDLMVALWGVSRSPEKSTFVATLDPRLAIGPWAYVNKLLDLPRTPFRTWKSAAAYALSFVGTSLLIGSTTYLLMLGGVSNKLDQLFLSCGPEDIKSCAKQSSVWAQQMLVWIVFSLLAVRLAAFMQSAAKTIGGLSVSDVLKSSEEHFVLYLRAFDTDDVILPKPRLPLLSKLFTMNPFPIRVEEELFDVADGYCPLIAVGKPGSAASKTGGLAYRAYLDDSDWQSYVRDKIHRADSIVILLRNTDGVRWEVSRILSEGAAAKTLFLFDPVAKEPEIWRTLAKTFLPLFESAGLVAPGFAFSGQPIGFFFEGGELASIKNTHWTATSYRTAFSSFLAERTARIDCLSGA